MSADLHDIEKLAFRARKELDLTTKAFDALRERYLSELLASQTPEEAYHGVMAVRALDSVMASLDQTIEEPQIEKAARENEHG